MRHRRLRHKGEGMKRLALNFVTILSLLMCVVATAVWLRGYWRADLVRFARVQFQGLRMTNEAYDVASARGGLTLGWGFTQNDFPSKAVADTVRGRTGPADGRFHLQAMQLYWLQYAGGFFQQGSGRLRLGFGFRSVDSAWPPAAPTIIQRGRQVVVPWPVVVLVTGALPAGRIWVSRRCALRRRRAAAGGCRKCGYDMRATPSRCPECGTDASQPQPQPQAQPQPA
jgi:hypothetical protein